MTIYRVTADYAETTFNVPAGVTNIGGYAFAYNTSIEKIVLPSTVTTLNDRAFRDTSASVVVLNEGLENISYQAFRNAINVKEVVIPSTVKTIAKEAFQHSGVTSLVIPANVETIEYGGLRDMKALETVVIKGNVDIPVYAFRACTNLKTIVLEGDDVTFGGGSRGMIFTNKEDGNGSAITVYVANAIVKERLLAADTASKDYGGYKIVIGSYQQVDKPITVAPSVLEEDFLFPAGTNAVIYKNMYMSGEAQIVHTENAGLGLSNVTAELDHDVIIRKSGGAIFISDCEFTLTDGAKLISVDEGGDAYQVFMVNVTINGVLMDSTTIWDYVEGISYISITSV